MVTRIRDEESTTDGNLTRTNTIFIRGAAPRMPPTRDPLIHSAGRVNDSAPLALVLICMRIFCTAFAELQKTKCGRKFGLIELDDEAYGFFAAWYNEQSDQQDVLSSSTIAAGNQSSGLSKSKGLALRSSAVLEISLVGQVAAEKVLVQYKQGIGLEALVELLTPDFNDIINGARSYCQIITKQMVMLSTNWAAYVADQQALDPPSPQP